jgi:hypothetical protein
MATPQFQQFKVTPDLVKRSLLLGCPLPAVTTKAADPLKELVTP